MPTRRPSTTPGALEHSTGSPTAREARSNQECSPNQVVRNDEILVRIVLARTTAITRRGRRRSRGFGTNDSVLVTLPDTGSNGLGNHRIVALVTNDDEGPLDELLAHLGGHSHARQAVTVSEIKILFALYGGHPVLLDQLFDLGA